MIDALLLLARLLLAAVFAVAGVAKLVDRDGASQALSDFGVPEPLAAPSTLLLSLGEVAIAIALVPVATAWWGALGALALLALFIAVLSATLMRGRRPDCHCFGQVHAAPVGWATVGRNVALLLVAASVLSRGRDYSAPSVVAWAAPLTVGQRAAVASGVAGLALLAASLWLTLLLWRQQGRLLLRLEALEQKQRGTMTGPAQPEADVGLPIGTVAPEFALPNLLGERVTLESLRSQGNSVLLIFTDPGCVPCTELLPDASRWQRDGADRVTVAFVSRGGPEANRAKAVAHGLSTLLLQRDFEVAAAYEVERTPSAVVVRADGTIGSQLAAGAEAITAVAARALYVPVSGANGTAPAPYLGPVGEGQEAPDVTLPDLTGRPTSLHEFRGRNTLLLFWNPGCVFCERMLPELRALEAITTGDAPRLVLVSSGSVQANVDMELRVPILLDASFAVAQRFGVDGTPSAVLVDAAGRVASDAIVGAPAVLAMAHGSGLPSTRDLPLTV